MLYAEIRILQCGHKALFVPKACIISLKPKYGGSRLASNLVTYPPHTLVWPFVHSNGLPLRATDYFHGVVAPSPTQIPPCKSFMYLHNHCLCKIVTSLT